MAWHLGVGGLARVRARTMMAARSRHYVFPRGAAVAMAVTAMRARRRRIVRGGVVPAVSYAAGPSVSVRLGIGVVARGRAVMVAAAGGIDDRLGRDGAGARARVAVVDDVRRHSLSRG